jgi:hypothetical protein
MMAKRRSLVAWAVAAVVSILGGGFSARAEDPAAEWQRLQRENTMLRQQAELAKSGSPYLVLDVAGSRLRLMNGVTVLRDFPLGATSIGTPRAAFIELRSTADWRGRIWPAGKLEPPPRHERVEIDAPEPGKPAPPTFIPPAPADAIPAPPHYRLRFEGGLILEVQDADARVGLRERLADLASTLRSLGDEHLPRLRVTLPAELAGALYRSLPAETPLLVM